MGITLAAHTFPVSGAVLPGSLARKSVQTALLFMFLHLWHVTSPLAKEALICSMLPLPTLALAVAVSTILRAAQGR